LVALGDDVTDEHMFQAIGPQDDPVVIRHGDRRRTSARWELASTDEVRAVLRWLHGMRVGHTPPPIVLPRELAPRPPSSVQPDRGLLVVSNRLPDLRHVEGEDEKKKNVGGLVSALEPALRARGGMWLGWSGRTVPDIERI